jgi:pimeloyl-ACP methyl ester carboxylesterase
VTVADIDGIQLNYEVVGTGSPMVYLAGTRFDGAKDKANHIREHANDFQTILPDPRGTGASTHTAEVEPKDWVEDLAKLLEALRSPAVHLAAETLGTRIAVRFAADYPQYVKSLILNAPIAYSSPVGDGQRSRALVKCCGKAGGGRGEAHCFSQSFEYDSTTSPCGLPT